MVKLHTVLRSVTSRVPRVHGCGAKEEAGRAGETKADSGEPHWADDRGRAPRGR